MAIFKYLGPPATKASLSKPDQFTLRYNLPESYNDPYELFLLPDKSLENVEERAYYENFLKQLPQAPVTCFSKRPESVVMWAHYGQLSTGVCLEVNEDALFSEIDGGFISDVEYSDQPALISSASIQYVCATKKNRHTLSLLAEANRLAYFRKRTSWSYEQERRVFVPTAEVEEVNGMLLGTYSSKCVDRIIIGAHAEDELREVVTNWAEPSGVEILDMKYSRRVAEPFFRSKSQTLFWSGTEFRAENHCCSTCFEPLDEDYGETCQWCEITAPELQHFLASNATIAFLVTGVMDSIPLSFEGLTPRGRRYSDQVESNE